MLDAPLIDCHAHVWESGMPLAADAWKRPAQDYPVEAFIADLDAQGVRHGVIAAASLFGTYNDYSLEAVRRYPQRLRATANVAPDISVAQIDALQAAGVVGVRLQWFFLPRLPDMGPAFRNLCSALRDRGLHVHLNLDGARLVEVAARLMDTGVKLVIDHFGWHDPSLRLNAASYQGMLRLLDRGNAWVKMTSGYRHPDEHFPDWSVPVAYAQDLLQRHGPERLFWGSDAPFIGHEQVASYALAIERLHQCVPDAATRRAIDANAMRFYFGE